jgi:hypothetical protein
MPGEVAMSLFACFRPRRDIQPDVTSGSSVPETDLDRRSPDSQHVGARRLEARSGNGNPTPLFASITKICGQVAAFARCYRMMPPADI